MAGGGDHGVASMEGLGSRWRGRRNFRHGHGGFRGAAWRNSGRGRHRKAEPCTMSVVWTPTIRAYRVVEILS
jgi:hypothetical protein